MNQLELAKRWANGKGKVRACGSMFYETSNVGDSIYSFGHHFEMARRLPTGDFLYNGDGYSSTTSAHQAAVRRAIGDDDKVFLNTKILDKLRGRRVTIAAAEGIDAMDAILEVDGLVYLTTDTFGDITMHRIPRVMPIINAVNFVMGSFILSPGLPVYGVFQFERIGTLKEFAHLKGITVKGAVSLFGVHEFHREVKGIGKDKCKARVFLKSPSFALAETAPIRYVSGSVYVNGHRVMSCGSDVYKVIWASSPNED